ncbi:MAG: cytochrome c family protein [Candidatus Omnitrophica bacterium]|nr:cytochrome c family protein [Candidatus Omnitrophota bacterium]
MKKKLLLAGIGVVTVVVLQAFLAAAEQATYVGLEKCRGCHDKEYKDFQARKFAKAWTILEMRGKSTDAECLKCHATGYGQPGGFTSEEATPHLKYKQCEACHGPGSIHANNPGDKAAHELMRTYVRDKDVCIQCHVCMKTHKAETFE